MTGEDNDQDDSDDFLLKKIREDYEKANGHWSSFYEKMNADIAFFLGEGHWDDIPEDSPNKVKLVINKCPSFVNNIVNEMRASRPAIRILPADDDANPETAEVRAGAIRKIEFVSDAETAYDIAALFQVISGLGWINVRTDWIPGTFDQQVYIEKNYDFTRCLIDPKSVELDGSDASFGFIQTILSEEEFKAQFPDAQPLNFLDKEGGAWCKGKDVIVTEYYYLDYEDEKIYQVTKNGELDVLREEDKAELEEKLGYTLENLDGNDDPMDGIVRIVQSRIDNVREVKWCKTNGQEILEKTDWLGDRIPIVPVYGNTIWNNGKRNISGIIEVMRDPQKMMNYWKSAHTEIVALQPKAPYIVAEGQIEEHQEMWKDGNRKNYPALIYTPTMSTKNGQVFPDPPPMRQPPPQPSAAMAQEALTSSEDLKSVTGIYDASQGKETNADRSGRAILALQRQGDTAGFHYIDNQSKSIRAVGKIVNDLLGKIYQGKRKIGILGEDKKPERIAINQPIEIMRDGVKTQGVHNFEIGSYDVTVTVGPSYASKRQEALEAQLELAGIMPEVMSVAADLIASNIDAPGMQEIAKRLKKALPPGLADEEQSPQQAALMKAEQAIELFKNQLIEMQKQLDSKERSENMDFEIKKEQNAIKEQEVRIKAFEAQIEAFKIEEEFGGVPKSVLSQIVSEIQKLRAGNDDITTALDLLLSEDEGETSLSPPNAMNIPPQGNQNYE